MRFISPWGEYALQCRPQVMVALGAGLAEERQAPLYARFKPGGLLPHERELAFHQWSWNGQAQEADEATPYPPDYRIGVFDSEQAKVASNWTDEEHDFVVEKLRKRATETNDLLEVPATLKAPPWPRYDEYRGTPAALVRKLVDEGYNLDDVLEYELQGQNRDKVVGAITAAISGDVFEEREEEVVG
ncbi:MAG TPA: hypothetical protein VLI07_18555 [Candidatus Binatus sp.]|nr:hypothetical protein [Candidatus Binatus sp.]